MRFTYEHLNADDRGGDTVADYLVGFEGALSVRDGTEVVYEEPDFPVVELARSLNLWVRRADGEDFSFESMSLAERGAISVSSTDGGWVTWSVYTPDVRSSAVPWDVIVDGVNAFVTQVREDLISMGTDAAAVLGE